MRRFSEKKKIHILAGVFASVGCILMVVFPTIALDSAQKGVTLWASSVLPALLPFFICANFMVMLGIPKLVGRFFERPFQKLFGAPGSAAFVFLISITSGYPMGAKLIGDMGRRKEITIRDAKRMLAFCSTSGPLFMLGAVGAGMLGSSAAGMVIAIAHYLGALANGLVFRMFSAGQKNEPVRLSPAAAGLMLPKEGLLESFTESIMSSFKTLGIICGYIVLFMLIADFIQFSGFLNFIGPDYGKGFAKGLLEMTIGCSSISKSAELTLLLKCALCSALISWGGLSILAQSASMLGGLDISVWYYMRVKLCHGLLAGLIAWGIGPFILGLSSSTTGLFESGGLQQIAWDPEFVYSLLFSSKMIIMIVILFILTAALSGLIGNRKKDQDESGRNHSRV